MISCLVSSRPEDSSFLCSDGSQRTINIDKNCQAMENRCSCRRRYAAPILPGLGARNLRAALGLKLLAFLRDQPIDQLDQLAFAARGFDLQPILAVDNDGRRAIDLIGLKQTLGRAHFDVHRE
jgi:hypothetical protein